MQSSPSFFSVGLCSDIPEKLVQAARNLFQLPPLRSDTPWLRTARRVAEIIGSMLYLFNPLLMLLALCFKPRAYTFGRTATSFKIGDEQQRLTQDFLEEELQRLVSTEVHYARIEIRQGFNFPPLNATPAVIESLKQLKAQRVNLWNVTIDIERIETLLASPSYEYRIMQDEHCETLHYQIARKEKIRQIVLPRDGEAAINLLQRLVNQQQRIHILYYTAYMHEDVEQQIASLVQRIHPDIECRILTEGNFTTEELV